MAETLEHEDIQGLLFSAYGHLTCAAYLLLRLDDPTAGRQWLGHVTEEVTRATGKQEGFSINVALTSAGLARLGLEDDALSTFSSAFQNGMTSPRRTKILGDTGDSQPDHWCWGGPKNEPVHVLLMLFAGEEGIDRQIDRQREAFSEERGVVELAALRAGREPDSKEHFGFNDGIGQPVIAGTGNLQHQLRRTGHATEVEPGEFILGYTNVYGIPSDSPTVAASSDPGGLLPVAHAGGQPGTAANDAVRHDLGRNGTYLVFRQMAQDVAAFWQFLDGATRDANGRSDPEARVRLASKFVGRWPSGAPLVQHPDQDPNAGTGALTHANNFAYAARDAHGFACPLGAHIRRTNPRDSLGPDPPTALRSANRHRLLRRGRSYGQRLADPLVDDRQERGLFFICLNSDIERQFEFVQQTWVNNPVFGGLNGEVDPLIGAQPLAADQKTGAGLMTVPADPLRTRVRSLARFVTVKGGAYFFMPGVRALRYLSGLGG